MLPVARVEYKIPNHKKSRLVITKRDFSLLTFNSQRSTALKVLTPQLLTINYLSNFAQHSTLNTQPFHSPLRGEPEGCPSLYSVGVLPVFALNDLEKYLGSLNPQA